MSRHRRQRSGSDARVGVIEAPTTAMNGLWDAATTDQQLPATVTAVRPVGNGWSLWSWAPLSSRSWSWPFGSEHYRRHHHPQQQTVYCRAISGAIGSVTTDSSSSWLSDSAASTTTTATSATSASTLESHWVPPTAWGRDGGEGCERGGRRWRQMRNTAGTVWWGWWNPGSWWWWTLTTLSTGSAAGAGADQGECAGEDGQRVRHREERGRGHERRPWSRSRERTDDADGEPVESPSQQPELREGCGHGVWRDESRRRSRSRSRSRSLSPVRNRHTVPALKGILRDTITRHSNDIRDGGGPSNRSRRHASPRPLQTSNPSHHTHPRPRQHDRPCGHRCGNGNARFTRGPTLRKEYKRMGRGEDGRPSSRRDWSPLSSTSITTLGEHQGQRQIGRKKECEKPGGDKPQGSSWNRPPPAEIVDWPSFSSGSRGY